MIFQIMQNGLAPWQNLILLTATLITVLVSMTAHEFAHGLVSYIQGDPTAKRMGRLTINPIKHISPIGFLCMLFCGFGWAKGVPVDTRYYKNAKKGMAITALSGPLMNLIIGVSTTVSLATLTFLWNTGMIAGFPVLRYMSASVYETVNFTLYIVLYYNLLFAVFNLLPIPPFDGSRLLFAILPDKHYFKVMRYEFFIMLVVFLMLWSGMFTGIFEFFVDGIIRLTSNAVFTVLELAVKLFAKI